jgi:serine/threonine protein kinase
MSTLNHKHTVKFYGYCSEQQMIILELVLMGSLNKFFATNYQKITIEIMNLWCLQIADGMRYLESKSIIHRFLLLVILKLILIELNFNSLNSLLQIKEI